MNKITYYPYDKQGFYTELPVEFEELADPPPNATKFKPIAREGHRPWWSGMGWIQVVDIRGLTLDQKKAAMLTLTTAIKPPFAESKYSLAETASWPYQLEEAKAIERGEAPGPMLQALAEAEGIKIKDLAARVLTKHAERVQAIARSTVAVQKLRNQIQGATSETQLPGLGGIMRAIYR